MQTQIGKWIVLMSPCEHNVTVKHSATIDKYNKLPDKKISTTELCVLKLEEEEESANHTGAEYVDILASAKLRLSQQGHDGAVACT